MGCVFEAKKEIGETGLPMTDNLSIPSEQVKKVEARKERALAISASGARLIFEIGVIKELVETCSPQDVQWKYVFGTSGGAIVASFLCQYPIGKEKQAVDDMKELIREYIGSTATIPHLPFGKLQGLLWHKSFYSSAFIDGLVRNNISPEKLRNSGRQLRIYALDYSTAQNIEYDQNHPSIIDAIIASCSIPIFFPPHGIYDPITEETIFSGDGGIIDYIAIPRALSNSNITHVDVIISIGEEENRSMGLVLPGKYPDFGNIANAMVEGLYKTIVDRTEDAVNFANMCTFMQLQKKSQTTHYASIPPKVRRQLETSKNYKERTDYVILKVYRPQGPMNLGVSAEMTLSPAIWAAGADAVRIITKNRTKEDESS